MLKIVTLILFVCLIVYFVLTFIVMKKYNKMRKTTKFLLAKYNQINKKSFVLDRYLSLYEYKKVSISEVYSSFMDLYAEVLDIDDSLRSGE